MSYLLIAIIVLVIIVIILLIAKEPLNTGHLAAKFLKRPWEIYAHSDGTFDDVAKLAMERALDRDNHTASDFTLAATILTRTNNATPAVGGYHLNALQTLRQNNRREEEVPAGFVLDMVYDHLLEFFYQDELRNELLVTENIIQDNRLENAIKNSGNAKGAVVDEFLASAIQHTNDPQNVHDSGVVASIKHIMNIIDPNVNENLPVNMNLPVNSIIRQKLHYMPFNNHKKETIGKVLDVIEKKNFISSIKMTDYECMMKVWERCHHPLNTKNRDSLVEAFFEALYECMEDDFTGKPHVICASGRISRVISALTLLDFDEKTWEIRKFEQHKNEIFETAGKLIKTIAKRVSKEADDIEMKKAALLYLAETQSEVTAIGEVSKEASDLLSAEMKNRIETMVDEYAEKTGAIPLNRIQSLKNEATAAI